jgi:hypothetical protein
MGAGAGVVGEEEDPRTACLSVTDSVAGSLEDSPPPLESVPLEGFGVVEGGVEDETVVERDFREGSDPECAEEAEVSGGR